jgi:hypothetical protein
MKLVKSQNGGAIVIKIIKGLVALSHQCKVK